MELLRNFKELNKSDVGLAGGKGASLGEMTQAGIPVPPGFVILSASFEKFIEETGLAADIDAILDSVNHEEIHTVENASEKIRALILAATMPKDIAREITSSFKKLGAKYVAVRSSATAEDSASAAWAGQLDSFLNTSQSKVLENVKRCWASLFTPRAIFYRFEKDLHKQKISVAVVVQKMVESEISGIAFSVHPVTQDRNQLIIEASYGLGEAIVSGQVTPDSYVVEKTPRRIIERMVQAKTRGLYRSPKAENEWKEIPASKAEQQALSDKQVLELSELILRIEEHYGFPCDIEWALEKEKFYIVQSRPITTLMDVVAPEKSGDTSMAKGYTFEEAMEDMKTNTHWYNKSFSGYPFGIAQQGMGIAYGSEATPYAIPYGLFFQNYNRNDRFDWFWNADLMVQKRKEVLAEAIKNPNFTKEFYGDWEHEWDIFLKHWEVVAHADLSTMSPSELRKKFQPIHDAIVRHTSYAYVVDTFLNDAEEDWLERFIKDELGKKATPEVVALLTAPAYGSFVNEFEVRKLEVAQRIHRGGAKGSKKDLLRGECRPIVHDFFWARAGYHICVRLTPEDVYQEALDESKKLGNGIAAKIREEKTRISENKKKKAELMRTLGVSKELRRVIEISEIFTHIQDKRKEGVLRGNSLFFEALGVTAAKNDIDPELIFYITPSEFLDPKKFAAIDWNEVRLRRDKGALFVFSAGECRVISRSEYEKEISVEHFFPSSLGVDEIRGTVAYKGLVRGIARVATNMSEIEAFNEGDILVANQTTPEYVPAMKKASAFVTDQGGITCHAAIIAREMKKPCIIGTKNASRVIKSGDMVEVDADKGVVRILERSSGQVTFEKIYTRDTTYIMQELWAIGCSRGVEKEFGWKNPYLPGIIHYMNQGSIEIWENLRATEWLEDVVLKKNEEDPKFIDDVLEKYKAKLAIIHKLWKEKKLGVNKLAQLIKLSDEAMPYFVFYYYSAVNDKTPKGIRAKALAMRNKDEFFAQNDIAIRKSISEIYPRTKNYETTIFIDEIKKIPAAPELEDRKLHSLIVDGKDLFLGTLSDFEKNNPQFSFKGDAIVGNNSGVIKGEIAQKGIATGPVKILRRRDQLDEVREGDIIVSPMTTPDFLPTMRRAAAFVTDEGGITCHAGIVARELKKPCIIGTKIATQVLKDGDVVEVDANRGVVRILHGDSAGMPPSSVKLFKFMTREHSFFYASIWNEADRDHFERYIPGTNFRNMAFLRDASGVVDIYFDLDELEEIFKKISQAIIEDPKLLDVIIADFYRYWKKLWLYISKKKKIKNLKELAGYYNDCVQWWVPMAYLFGVPDREEIPKRLRAKALKVRESTQEYSNEIDRVYRDFFEKKYPRHTAVAGLLMPEEVYRIEKLTRKDLEEIKKRKEGWALTTMGGKTEFKPLSEVRGITNILSKIYSREKTLFYFSMWNDSDRRGWKNFLGHNVRQNLFIVPPPGEKGSVWYSSAELAIINTLLKEKLKSDPTLVRRFVKTLDANWKVISPYLLDKKKIRTVKDFNNYYEHLVDWWSAMNTAFTIPDMAEVSPALRKKFLRYREESEKYTEKMNKVMVAFWHDRFPELKDITFFIAPGEVAKLAGNSREKVLALVRSRRNGCVMLNGTIYPIERLDALLSENNIELEKATAEGIAEIKGTPAYKGVVRGRVKKIRSFADMKDFAPGDVLVTEMTNPDYVPIMKKAAAVVTDEGGTTCHAAIASRELKVPCVVGTKIATQVLKDGDMVEVDADKGIVKILK